MRRPPHALLRIGRATSRGTVRRTLGVTLVELVIFIVLVSAAFAAFLSVFNAMVVKSGDPQVRKQAIAIAESLMEEVQLMPFSFCDPDDSAARTATSTAGCTGGVPGSEEGIGPEGGETRFGAVPFDNVNDYHMTVATTGITDIDGNPITPLATYTWMIEITYADLGSITAASKDALRIRVIVTAPENIATVTLDGYRTRYAPNTVP